MDLQIDQVAPVRYPFIEQPPVAGLHQLITSLE